MICLVDTSVWVDFFKGRKTEKTKLLQYLITKNVDLVYSGVVLTEVLMGFKQEQQYRIAKELFGKLIYLEASRKTHALAADIYRQARKQGITIRSTIDCLISATAIENNVYLLENDRDFESIARFSDLKLVTRN